MYENGGIYHFVSHPQWLDYGPDHFYEQHLAHLSGRTDIWYVPLGPLYAFQVLTENTVVSRIVSHPANERFVVYSSLDATIYTQSITLKFSVAGGKGLQVLTNGCPLFERGPEQLTNRWSLEYFRRQGEFAFITLHPNTILEILSVD